MIEIKRMHAIAIVIAAALLVYANSLWNGFAYDDVHIIYQNDRVHQLRDLGRIWLTPYWPAFGTQLGLYRPFAIFAFAIEWAIGGGQPWVFHLANVLLHAAVSLLAFLLIEKLFTARAAVAGALIFAIHPVHTEAVANVVGQNELWAAIGVLGACLIYVSRPEGVAVSWKRGIPILLLYAMALLAKESAVVLPGLLVLLDFVQGRVQPNRESLLRYARGIALLIAAFISVLLAYLVQRHAVLGNLAGTDAAPGLPYLREEHRVLNAFRAWPEFIRLSIFPLDLSVDYAPGVILPSESITPMVLLGMVLVAATVGLMLATPWAPRAGLAAGWFLITLLPVSNFFFPIGVLIAERTLYMPSLAVCFLAGFAWEALARPEVQRETRRLAYGLAVVIVLFFSGRTVLRNPSWDNLGAVWKSLIRDHPESYRAQWITAINAWSAGQHELAEKYFQLAYRIWPRDSQMLSEFANFYISQRKYDEAIRLLEQSRAMTAFVPRTHELLAYAYLHAGKTDEAMSSAQRAAEMRGMHPAITYGVIAGVHERRGEFAQAVGAWQRVVASNGGTLWLNWAMLARAQAYLGTTQDALSSVDAAAARTGKQPLALRTVAALRQAIEAGCYQQFPAGSCDPLKDWLIAAPAPVPQGG